MLILVFRSDPPSLRSFAAKPRFVRGFVRSSIVPCLERERGRRPPRGRQTYPRMWTGWERERVAMIGSQARTACTCANLEEEHNSSLYRICANILTRPLGGGMGQAFSPDCIEVHCIVIGYSWSVYARTLEIETCLRYQCREAATALILLIPGKAALVSS